MSNDESFQRLPLDLLGGSENAPTPGRKPPPLTREEVIGSPYHLHGPDAVREVERMEGKLTPAQKNVVKYEGFVNRPYYDDNDVLTYGVGQTGEYINKGFKESFKAHEDRARNNIKNFDKLPDEVKAELIQAEYRGDLGGSPKFLELFNAGKYREAAEEFLNHEEYKKRKKEGRDSVVKRMEAVRDAVRKLATPPGSWYN